MQDDIGLVSICTPPFTHTELAVAFLSAGKDVILEKPMAASLSECDAIIEAEKKSGRSVRHGSKPLQNTYCEFEENAGYRFDWRCRPCAGRFPMVAGACLR